MKGRPPRLDNPARWTVWLPGDLVARLEILLLDPVRAQARYGAKSELVRVTLEHLLREKCKNEETPNGPRND